MKEKNVKKIYTSLHPPSPYFTGSFLQINLFVSLKPG